MKQRKTSVSIQGDRFMINGEPTYKGRYWNGHRIEGLLMNSRMIQGIFDDKNPDTVDSWAYPDTGKWDPERNTREFIEHMPLWKRHGLLAFTIGLQGGSPEGYSQLQPWHSSAFGADGSLDPAYMDRLERIMDRADELGMVVILNYFYFGQDRRFSGEAAIRRAVANATGWIVRRGYANVLIDLVNECDIELYTYDILRVGRIHELIELVRLAACAADPEAKPLVSTSFRGPTVPSNDVLAVSDFVLIHGNSGKPEWVPQQIDITRRREAYRGQPIVNNEDDHYDFDRETNHLVLSVKNGVSWGYLDLGPNNYADGYQCPPVNWGISSERKRQFFNKLKEITGV